LSASDCDRIGLLLEPYAGGELPGEVAQCVEAHLTECPECARRAAQLLAPVKMLRAWPALSTEDVSALAAQRAELTQVFAVRQRAALGRRPGPARSNAAWQVFGWLAGVSGPPARRALGSVSRSSARWALAGLGWLAPRAGNLLGTAVAGRPPRADPARPPEIRRKTLGARLRRSALAASTWAIRAGAKAGKGALALG
jgi:anti-sigma factor RsiW